MGRFGENRDFALCALCGHPRMAHVGQACPCGCRGEVGEPLAHASSLITAPRPSTAPRREKAYSISEIRKTHPNAYEPWSDADDEELAAFYRRTISVMTHREAVRILAQAFGRQRGGIRSRLRKLGLAE